MGEQVAAGIKKRINRSASDGRNPAAADAARQPATEIARQPATEIARQPATNIARQPATNIARQGNESESHHVPSVSKDTTAQTDAECRRT